MKNLLPFLFLALSFSAYSQSWVSGNNHSANLLYLEHGHSKVQNVKQDLYKSLYSECGCDVVSFTDSIAISKFGISELEASMVRSVLLSGYKAYKDSKDAFLELNEFTKKCPE